MTKINIFDEIRDSAQGRNRAIEFYLEQIKKLKSRGLVTKNRLYTYDQMVTSKLEVGSMYLYVYDAKFKKTLPVWDAFPLCIPISINPGDPKTGAEANWVGLNFHYIPPRMRWEILKMLTKIDQFSVAKKLPADKKMELSWDYLKHTEQSPIFKQMIHKYLFSHVVPQAQGRYLKILPNDWHHSILLPVQDFRTNNPKNKSGYSSVQAPKVWRGDYRK